MMNSSENSRGEKDSAHPKIKLMVVDDSAVIRGLLTRTLESDPAIEIVASLPNGEMAVNRVKDKAPDVIVLDVEMPVMDGLTALPLIMKEKPDVKVLICSTLSEKGAAISIKALSLGAADCLVKPTSTSEIGGSADFNANLLRLVKALGKPASKQDKKNTATQSAHTDRPALPSLKLLNDVYTGPPDILAIGSSTGGPQALQVVLQHLKDLPVPIVITQHMPKTFTAMLADHISNTIGLPTSEGADNMILKAGHAYVAPGDMHMVFEREDDLTRIKLDDSPPVNFCKPAVDPMLDSLATIYGKKVMTLILTGMGHDGLDGCKTLVGKSAPVIAQDEDTSVVWGMPGAVAKEKLCYRILPLEEIGPWVRRKVK